MKINNDFIENALQYNMTEDEIQILEDVHFHESLENIIYELNFKLPNKKIETLLTSWIVSKLTNPINEDKLKKVLNIIYKIKQEDILKKLESYNIKIHPQNITLIENIFNNATVDKKYTFRLENNLKNINNLIEIGAWEKIYSSLHLAHTELKYCIDFSAIHAFYLLTQLKSKSELITLFKKITDIPTLWGIFANLDSSLLLNLTHESDTPHIIFCTLSSLFPFESRERPFLTENENTLVTNILIKCSYKKEFWYEILKIFNTYPLRYPTLQKNLGKALAIINDETCINIYIDTLYLYPINSNDEGRNCIKICLEEFERLASNKLKIFLYTKAFNVWMEWKFDIPKTGYLFNIKFSLLDFAIVKYYKNTCSDEKINFIIKDKIEEMWDIDNNWYKSSTEFTAQWYWYLSSLQPLFHLQMLNNGTELNFLQVNKEYQFEKLDRFISIRIKS